MKCPKCNHTQSRVVDSRHADDMNAIRRRRECDNCGTRFTTFEHIEMSPLIVVKKDGTREQFNREKILNGLVRSCEKRPVRFQQLEEITNQVEWKLREEGIAEVSSRDIGEYVMNLLMLVDQVSYVRFASVYREFKDVDQLLQSMQGILKENKRSE
ncbi:transcriptional repressor NrdR [Staphylococcus pseudintermedius]|uniref:transcriptional regulator NrdR n=2 Tax=Staphylococcus pseudintermedius TaxID=283734 RepID=UPI00080613C1|nr:transcriptional regulator NrdR [Staphylococcus pseudintermedius]ANQ81570.1 transcriptional regulator NrdR [Staphylococcus pseudintermedius]EGQ0293619.1 transcriptional repressor NrdR [Staphylococcus pseudintermedius]EGQ0331268.1 transcriptional repressor NrdR [Staphylococcus pseudintermedius]EGQ0375679.1 transcriptional repressor NrdR [Staphylococcus pseudintermedius]EGQ1739279.1 transcriptional repressor NrdR [Staphylococcus pseudintermedius]